MRKRFTERMEIKLTPELKKELDNQAEKRLMSSASIIREALMLLFDQWAAFDERGQGTE